MVWYVTSIMFFVTTFQISLAPIISFVVCPFHYAQSLIQDSRRDGSSFRDILKLQCLSELKRKFNCDTELHVRSKSYDLLFFIQF
jgi:hypothetical protein